MRPFRKDRAAVLKEHQQVGTAVGIDVYDGSYIFVGSGIEFLDQIDAVVEIAVRVAAHECAVLVMLVHIGPAVEIRINRDVGELALAIVGAPDIGAPVPVLIRAADVSGR